MKNVVRFFFLSIVFGSMTLFFSCKDGDDALDDIKVDENSDNNAVLKLTAMNGNDPVANADIIITEADTDVTIDTLSTDSHGTITFESATGGTFGFSFINSAPYTEVYVEGDLVKGESTELTVQVEDYVGSLTFQLLDVSTSPESLITADFDLGIALVPYNENSQNVIDKQELYDLAIVKKFKDGEAAFDDLPVATYRVYRTHADSITVRMEDEEQSDITYTAIEGKDDVFKIESAEIYERLFAQSSWNIKGVYNDLGEEVADFPLTAIQFIKDSYGKDSYKFDMEDGAYFLDDFYYFPEENGFLTNDAYSNDGPYYVYFNSQKFEIDEDGNVIMYFDSIQIKDYKVEETLYNFGNIHLVLE